ncbi:hypothetical protein [Algibacter lectus]|uniref:hypothetical protein n=1 Tax=Algibacter lectus TaxID=221126 RepID=UPI00187CEF7B|nr:hypothetical protein [Algibacter lectus]
MRDKNSMRFGLVGFTGIISGKLAKLTPFGIMAIGFVKPKALIVLTSIGAVA